MHSTDPPPSVQSLARTAHRVLLVAVVVVTCALLFMVFDFDGRIGSLRNIAFFYLLPGGVLLGLLAVLRASVEAKIKTVLLLIFTVLPLLLVEGAIEWRTQRRVFQGASPNDVYEACPGLWAMDEVCFDAAIKGRAFDIRTRLDVISDYADAGTSAWPNVYAGLVSEGNYLQVAGKDLRPLSGIANAFTVFCNETGTWRAYQADEHGFNNPSGLHNADIEVLLVGDSFTQGRCVPNEANFQTQIRAIYPRTVSIGLDGSGPLHELASLREFGARLKPKAVLWMFFEGNDLLDLESRKNDRILRAYLNPAYSQGLAAQQDAVDEVLREHLNALRVIEEEKTERRSLQRARSHRAANVMSPWSLLTLRRIRIALLGTLEKRQVATTTYHDVLFRSILAQAKSEVESWGGTMIFVYLPAWQRFDNPSIGFGHRDEVLADVASLDLPLVDLVPLFEAHEDWRSLFPFGLVGHYNEAGFLMAGKLILAELDRSDP